MSEMVKTLVNGEWEIMLPKHRADNPAWYTEEGWERKRLDSMSQHIGKNDVVYYVGAEEGEMPALCQMWGAKVVLFEPNPLVFPNIRAIWQGNELEHPAGVFVGFAGNKTIDRPHTPSPLLSKGEKDGWPMCAYGEVIDDHGFKELYLEADAFPQVRIDDYVAQSGLVPTALSIDVEGSECRVLEGAEETLKQHQPKIWLSGHPEFMFHQYEEYLTDLRNWIKGFGYKETFLDYQHEVHLFYEMP